MDRLIVNADLPSNVVPETITFTFVAFVRLFFLIYFVTAITLKCINLGYVDKFVQK